MLMNYLNFITEAADPLVCWALRKKVKKTVVTCPVQFMEDSDLTYSILVYAVNMAEILFCKNPFILFCKNKGRKKRAKNTSFEPFSVFHILAEVKKLSLRLFSFHFLHFAKSFDKTIFPPR